MATDIVNKIRNGTRSDSTDLCASCCKCVIRKGGRESDEARYCNEFMNQLRGRVSECSGYYNKNLPSIRDLRETAWILSTDKKKEIGFQPYKKWKDNNRDDDGILEDYQTMKHDLSNICCLVLHSINGVTQPACRMCNNCHKWVEYRNQKEFCSGTQNEKQKDNYQWYTNPNTNRS